MGLIENRRSIRKFTNREIEKEKLMEILKAGMMAPSPKNRQPWKFVVIVDTNTKKKIVDEMRCHIKSELLLKKERLDIQSSLDTIDVMNQASVLILVCYHYGLVIQHDDGINWKMKATDLEAVELQSIGASVENMLLKAEELGLGSLWCADILYAYPVIKKYCEFPVISAVCLGYRAEQPLFRKRKELSEMCTFI